MSADKYPSIFSRQMATIVYTLTSEGSVEVTVLKFESGLIPDLEGVFKTPSIKSNILPRV